MLIRKHIIVTGNVQGVGYRYFAKQLADSLDIKGFVRNRMDGSVELGIECDDNSINGFIDSLREKHPWARVEDIAVTELQDQGIYIHFEIRR